jgi:ABC-type transporter Mla subunit MlaD
MMSKQEAADVLTDVKERIIEALEEARAAIEDAAPEEWDWAEAYWWSHIRTALDEDHDYVGGAGQTLQTTIDSLKKVED